MREIPFAHPGEILHEDFLKPPGISQYALSKAIGMPPRRINEIVQGKRSISVDTALRLAVFFGTDAQSWINLHSHFDAEQAREILADVLARIKPYQAESNGKLIDQSSQGLRSQLLKDLISSVA